VAPVPSRTDGPVLEQLQEDFDEHHIGACYKISSNLHNSEVRWSRSAKELRLLEICFCLLRT